jgi:multidrug efflux pump subunit AcrB
MERLIRFFVRRHLLVNAITLAMLAGGSIIALRLGVEGIPAVDFPTFMISANLPGASARDVETKLTIPLEEALEEVDGVDHYTTEVTSNRTVTTVEFSYETPREEILEKEREIRTAIEGVPDFPVEMVDDPMIVRLDPSKQPVLEYALAGPRELLPDIAAEVERRMERVPEVARADVIGLPDPEIRILIDPDLARTHGIALLDIVRALKNRNVSATGGALETASARRQVVLWSRFETPEEIGDVILRFEPGRGAVRVRDVARVEAGREDTGLIAGTNGRAGVSLIPTKRRNADLIQAQAHLLESLETLKLPEGVTGTVVNDSSYDIRNRMEIIANNGIMGIALVAIIVFLFLAPSAATWVCVGVPVVILGVLVVMPQFDMTLNFMSTTAFVVILGLLVDDAVVVAEKILLTRQEGYSPEDAAIEGASRVARPVIASAVTTLLAFAPLMAIGGFPQKIIWQLPAVVCIALVLSVLESFLILPAHMSMVRQNAKPQPKRAFVVRMERWYRSALEHTLPRRGRVIAGFAAAWVAIMLGLAPKMQFEFFPQEGSRAIFLKVTTPVGSPIERTEAVLDAIQQQIPMLLGTDLEGMTARVGHQEPEVQTRDYGSAEHEGLISAYLDPEQRNRTAAEWIQILKRDLRVPYGAEVVFEAAVDGPPGLEPISIYVLANDDLTRRETTRELHAYLSGIAGVTDLSVNEQPGMREIDLNLDYERLALRGLDAQAVARTLQGAFYGLIATEIRDIDDSIDVRVLFEPSTRNALDALLDTTVRNDTGALVPLRDVVDPIETPSLAAIFHRDGIRAANVIGGFTPNSPYTATSLASKVEREFLSRYAGRTDVTLELAGEVVQSRQAMGDLGVVFVFAVIAIGVVIAIMLGSVLEAVFVLAVVPFSIAAVILSMYVHGKHFSLLAVIGAIGLAGVVVNSAIVMIDSVHRAQLGAHGDEVRRTAAMIDALVSRLRPILVTSLSTLGGVLPTAYGLGGYDDVMAPLSLAIGWGIALSSGVTLFLVPALYVTANDWTRRIEGQISRWRGGPRALEEAA